MATGPLGRRESPNDSQAALTVGLGEVEALARRDSQPSLIAGRYRVVRLAAKPGAIDGGCAAV